MAEVYCVEDDPVIAGMVKEYLEEKGFRVRTGATLVKAKEDLLAHVPALVLLDWNMPDGCGDGLCRWIRRNWKDLPVIFLTVRGESRDMVSGFQSGADDYVVKPFALEVLYARILALLRRSRNTSDDYLSCDGICLDQNRRTVTVCSEEIALSAAEYRLLVYLMQHKGRTVTMKRLRDKLGQPACLKTIRSVGYRMEDTK